MLSLKLFNKLLTFIFYDKINEKGRISYEK